MNKSKKKKATSLSAKKARMGWVFVSPFLVGFVLFYSVMIVDSLKFSFMEVSTMPQGGFTTKFVGWANYNYMTRTIEYFNTQMMDSVRQMLLSLLTLLLFSLFVAMLLNKEMKGRGLFRAIFFIPVILSTGIIAKSDAANNITAMFSSIDVGEITTATEEMTSAFNVDGLMYYIEDIFSFSPTILKIIEQAATNVYGIINQAGVQILIFLAGLQSISPSLYEAAQIEGCSKWESFWKITFPMISPMIITNLVYTIVDSFTKYDNNVMRIISEQMKSADYGHAAAASWIYFCIIAVIVVVIFGIANKFVFYQNRER